MPRWKRVVKIFDLTTVAIVLLVITNIWMFSRWINWALLIVAAVLIIADFLRSTKQH